jgi:hypothetical protein
MHRGQFDLEILRHGPKYWYGLQQEECGMTYRVYLDSNFHQMDTSTRTMSGEYPDHDLAVAAAREVIDGILESEHRKSMTAEELLHVYVNRSEEPFIIPEGQPPFNAREYATLRCQELCSE